MASPIHAAVRCALRSARAVAYVDAVYKRGSESCPIQPIKSSVDVELISGDGSVTVAKVILWRVLAEELVIQGQRVEPAEGDRIEEQVGTSKHTYEVQTVGGESCFEPADPAHQGFLIRSRLVQTE